MSAVPSFYSDVPSEWSAPAFEPNPELLWHVLDGGERREAVKRCDGFKHGDFQLSM